MREDQVVIDQLVDYRIVQAVNLVHFMGGAETIKEMNERDPGLQGGRVRHQREVMRFLHGSRGQLRKAGGTGSHHVLVITENRQALRGQGAGCDVKYCWCQLSGNFVHVR